MANEARMREVVESIVNDPDSFKMENWGMRTSCGTTMCVAGHTVVNEGYVLNFHGYGVTMWCWKEGKSFQIDETAGELLELTREEANNIFLSMFWCPTRGGNISRYRLCENVYGRVLHTHGVATIRQVIGNISKVTGFEFKIPDHIE